MIFKIGNCFIPILKSKKSDWLHISFQNEIVSVYDSHVELTVE